MLRLLFNSLSAFLCHSSLVTSFSANDNAQLAGFYYKDGKTSGSPLRSNDFKSQQFFLYSRQHLKRAREWWIVWAKDKTYLSAAKELESARKRKRKRKLKDEHREIQECMNAYETSKRTYTRISVKHVQEMVRRKRAMYTCIQSFQRISIGLVSF